MYEKNNLGQATSPYLQQHKDNPIHRQEWSGDVIEYAKKRNKPLFVSVGYATCHRCHVMASESFSDTDIAEYLNKHFVSIKIDREQRPDIDRYMMSFIQATSGHGGRPLNVFLTPEVKPFFATTYVPDQPKYGRIGFLDLLQQIKKFYDENTGKIHDFTPSSSKGGASQGLTLEGISSSIEQYFNGKGFGDGPQFPPHNTLLYMLYAHEMTHDTNIKNIIDTILDTILHRGLHDHLQGGFYRYCVDQDWTIPHFEKMLYDQAMLLQVLALAYKQDVKPIYLDAIHKLIQALDETYLQDGLYVSAHDADTDHEEGLTYVRSFDELKQLLDDPSYELFARVYQLEENFEGHIHLIKNPTLSLSDTEKAQLADIEQRLLDVRKKREQPFTDRKIVTSWNALLAIGFVHLWRATSEQKHLDTAETIFTTLIEKHYATGSLYHSSLDGIVQEQSFLEDIGSMLLLATYLYEEERIDEQYIQEFSLLAEQFRDSEGWKENNTPDFGAVPATEFDHPAPSSVSMIHTGLLRKQILLGEEQEVVDFHSPHSYDYWNIMATISQGRRYQVHTDALLDRSSVPARTIQIVDGQKQVCYDGRCELYTTKKVLQTILQ